MLSRRDRIVGFDAGVYAASTSAWVAFAPSAASRFPTAQEMAVQSRPPLPVDCDASAVQPSGSHTAVFWSAWRTTSGCTGSAGGATTTLDALAYL